MNNRNHLAGWLAGLLGDIVKYKEITSLQWSRDVASSCDMFRENMPKMSPKGMCQNIYKLGSITARHLLAKPIVFVLVKEVKEKLV